MKAIARVAREHSAEWKPIHAAVMGCLLAHRNRKTGNCWPRRDLMAAHCGVSERTVDRILAQLAGWGAIERQQPRALSSQQFRPAQYTFLFPLPVQAAVEGHREKGIKVVDQAEDNEARVNEPWDKIMGSRGTKSEGAVGQNRREPWDKIGTAIRKEGKGLEGKDPQQSESLKTKGKGAPPPDSKIPNSNSQPETQPPTQLPTLDCPDCHGTRWKLVELPGNPKAQAALRCACQHEGISAEEMDEAHDVVAEMNLAEMNQGRGGEEEGFYVAGLGATVADMMKSGLTEPEAKAQYHYHRVLEAEKDRALDLREPATPQRPPNDRQPPANNRPRYTQDDFDERDWRKLQKEIALIRESRVGSAEADESQQVAFFRRACTRAGISTRRGDELYRKMLA